MRVYSRIDEEKVTKPVKLDLRDKKILSLLAKNSRMPVSEIAKKLAINRDTVIYKMKRMETLGVIRKYYCELDLSLFGYSTCHVFFLLDESDEDKKEELINVLKHHPYTKSVLEYNDKWDLEWILAVKEIKDLDSVMTKIQSKHGDVIMDKKQLVVVKYFQTTKLPFAFYKDLGVNVRETPPEKESIKIDEKDFKILRVLSENARENSVNIGKKVGLSTDAVIRRIKRLYDKHVITKFTILVDRRKMQYDWFTFAINMRSFDESDQNRLKEFVREHPYILRCVKTFGKFDVLMYLSSDKSADFHKTVKEIKKTFSGLIKDYDTWVAYREHCFNNFPKAVSYDDTWVQGPFAH